MHTEFRSLRAVHVSANIETQAPRSKNPAEEFLKWFDQQSSEHQVELSEFVGYFCYKPLFVTFTNMESKIFALREYLHSFREDLEGSIKVLQFIDQIMDFIVEINRDSESAYFNCEALINELPGITSLYSLLIDSSFRTKRWAFSFLQWQRFKASFHFFRELNFSGASDEKSGRSHLHPDPAILSRRNRKISTSGSPLL